MNQFQNDLLNLLDKPSVCMLAPSFPIDFKYPSIIGMLKTLGFEKVTELTFGARIVNYWYVEYVKSHPEQKYYITSPCPTCVALIKNRYPELLKYLVPHVSPMAAMAKIVKKYFQGYNVVFACPCLAKQNIEAPKYKDVIDLVITFKELSEVFNEKKILESDFEGKDYEFDSFYQEDTKIYPISGGLAITAHLLNYFKSSEIKVVDQPVNVMKVFDEIKSGKSEFRFFDILNCPGGCIGGPALVNTNLPVEEKKKRILSYQKLAGSKKVDTPVEKETDLDFSTNDF
jgi:iron only hydrogenase large subunit-like protein